MKCLTLKTGTDIYQLLFTHKVLTGVHTFDTC